MTVAIRLDANAVASLFDTPESKLELQQAVIAEIVRRMYEKYVPDDITSVVNGLFAQHRLDLIDAVRCDKATSERIDATLTKEIATIKKDAWNRPSGYKLKPEFLKELDSHQVLHVQSLLKEYGITGEQLIQAAAEAAFNRVQEKALANIDHRINSRVETITNAEIDRRVDERLKRAMTV